jgi:ABC-type transport system substrate-binding protein
MTQGSALQKQSHHVERDHAYSDSDADGGEQLTHVEVTPIIVFRTQVDAPVNGRKFTPTTDTVNGSRSMRRLILLVFILLLSGTGCGGSGGAPNRRTLIDSRDTYDPRSLDPALSTDVPTGRAVAYLFDGLVRFSPTAEVIPALAERWDVSPDGVTYTFHLRGGVRFHDGRPFLARHVISSWMRVLDPVTKGGRGWPLYPIKGAKEYADGKTTNVSGLSAPNDSTVVLELSEPFAIFPKMLAMPVAAVVPDSVPANFGENPVGTGPWKFVEWRHDDYILFVRNERYWGEKPQADSLMARIIPEPSTSVAEFQMGNVDVLSIPERETRDWEENEDLRPLLARAPTLRLVYVAINTTRGPLGDARVRRAINHSVDAGMMLRYLLGGRGRVAAGVIPPSLDGADTTRAPYARDVALAKRLLTEAGHPNGIDLELWSSQTAPMPRLAQTMQAFLAEAGIRVKLVQRDASSVRQAARNGQVDLFLKDWFADYPDSENFLYPLLHSASKGVGGNVSFFANPRFDSIVTASRREQDAGRRAILYRQADSLAFAEAPMLFLFFSQDVIAVQPWIKGFSVPYIFTGQPWTSVRIVRDSTTGTP